ncbi:MAG: MarR family transcriptional regulator [Halodesulfurarchaeum sp.]
MQAVVPQSHEFAANFLFNEEGLQPYFAADSQVKAGGGSQRSTFYVDGEQWVAKLYYQDSGILHPEDPRQNRPRGVEWHLDTVREFRISVQRHSEEDPVGEQKVNFRVSPRWEWMKAERESGQVVDLSVPPNFGTGINVRATGANIDFHRYEELLREAAGSLGINRRYFEHPHRYSNVQDAARYVRVHRDASGPVHARDGPIARMGHLLENDRSGYRKVVQNDNTEKGENRPGYYHTVTLDQRRVQEAFPSHELPVEIKHYYARDPQALEADNPLAHPKVEASYQTSRWDGTLGVTDEELTQLKRELDREVRSVLADAGVDIAPERDTGPFVEDAYFEVEVSERGPNPVDLDLTRIRQESESIVVKHLADGLSPVQWETFETLVSDGGEVAPEDVAEEQNRHINSVYRALPGIEEFLDRSYGELALKNEYLAELVLDAVEEAREFNERALETVAKVKEASERGLEAGTSAFIAWCSKHGIDVDNREEARMEIRMGDRSNQETKRRLQRAYELWTDANRDPARFRQAKVRFDSGAVSSAWYYLTG